jgi:hypothetical protein
LQERLSTSNLNGLLKNFLSVVAERGGRVESEGRESHVTGLLALAAAPTLQEEEMTAGNSSSDNSSSSSSDNSSGDNSLLLTVCQLLIAGGTSYLGLETEFRSEKIPRNRLGMVSVIPRKKALIPRHSEFRGMPIPMLGTERNGMPRKKLVLQNISKIT